MNEFYLFLLLIGIIKIVGSNELHVAAPDPSKNGKYNCIRYWTFVDSDGKTYISLNILKEAVNGTLKLFFPKDQNFTQILSDITLFSPTSDQCRHKCRERENEMEFKLIFSAKEWIRGQIYYSFRFERVRADVFKKCSNKYEEGYMYKSIENTFLSLENEDSCFHDYNPLKLYNDKTRVMELKVSGTCMCQAFMILPHYANLEDLSPLPADIREPLNETFAAQGEEFWWKSGNNDSLSDGISFAGRDVVVDITKSTRAIPYFLRIGKGQPYPSLQFKFDANCSGQQYELFVNLRSDDNCKIVINLGEEEIRFTTRGTATTQIYEPSKSPTLIFARAESKVYIKSKTHLSINEMNTCQIENPADVPDDQFVIQIIPSRGYTVCSLAQVLIPAGDVKNKIEVLLDRIKAAKLIGKDTEATSAETTKVANASFEWWWIAIGLLLLIVIALILANIIYFVIRRRKQNEMSKTPSKMNNDQKVESLNPTPKSQTVIPIEEPQRKKKTIKKNKSKKEKKETSESSKSKKRSQHTAQEQKNQYEEYLPSPAKMPPAKTPKQSSEKALQKFQDDPTVKSSSTQKSITGNSVE